MIYFDRVTKTYSDGPPAVEDITLSIEPGEFVSIVGHSGAGKTTLLKMLFAEIFPTKGTVYFGSREIAGLSEKELLSLRRNIGTIFQDFRLLPTKNVYENIAFAMEVAGKPDEDIQADVPHVLDLVGLSDKMWNFPKQLSGGEQQRVAIARALANDPPIVLADEPTGNLDSATGRHIMEMLLEVRRGRGSTMVLVTHDAELAALADTRLVLRDGRSVESPVAAR